VQYGDQMCMYGGMNESFVQNIVERMRYMKFLVKQHSFYEILSC